MLCIGYSICENPVVTPFPRQVEQQWASSLNYTRGLTLQYAYA